MTEQDGGTKEFDQGFSENTGLEEGQKADGVAETRWQLAAGRWSRKRKRIGISEGPLDSYGEWK